MQPPLAGGADVHARVACARRRGPRGPGCQWRRRTTSWLRSRATPYSAVLDWESAAERPKVMMRCAEAVRYCRYEDSESILPGPATECRSQACGDGLRPRTRGGATLHTRHGVNSLRSGGSTDARLSAVGVPRTAPLDPSLPFFHDGPWGPRTCRWVTVPAPRSSFSLASREGASSRTWVAQAVESARTVRRPARTPRGRSGRRCRCPTICGQRPSTPPTAIGCLPPRSLTRRRPTLRSAGGRGHRVRRRSIAAGALLRRRRLAPPT